MTVKVRKRQDREGAWQVDVRGILPDGTRYRERVKPPVTTYTAALRWGQQREAAILLAGGNTKRETREPAPTLAEFWPRFIEAHSRANREKPSSIHSKESIFKNHLNPALGAMRLDAIRDENVQRLKSELRDRSVKTTNNVLTVLGRLLKTAAEWDVVERMPCKVRLLKTSKPSVEFYEEEVYEALVEAARKADPRIHLAALLGGDAGLRLGEIIALEWPDVDFRRGLLTARRSEWRGEVTLPKGGKERVVPMTERLAAALGAHRHLRSPRVLVQDDATGVNRAWLWYAMKGAQRRAGMAQDGRFHILRHTFCSRLAARNVPMLTIKELAGHANLATTQRYMHLSQAAPREGIRALERGTARAPDASTMTKGSDDG